MRILLVALLTAATLAACGSDRGSTAIDPAGSDGPDGSSAMPTSVPAADGPVRTRRLAMVMDTGRPELCLGPVAESWPPQCGGPELRGWDWGDWDGMFERQGEVRWGEFAVTGTWDGTAFTFTDAIPAALHDAAVPEEPTYPTPAAEYSAAALADLARTLGGRLPGAQGAWSADGHVLVDVIHDDGSLQAWADQEYGENVVILTSALVPVDR